MKFARFLVAGILFLLPLSAEAAMQKSFEVSGWIPYWRAATGTADVLPNLDKLTEVNPFVYTLKSDGTLLDNAKLDREPWVTLRAEAKKRNIRFIPTVMTSNGALVHTLLSNSRSRIALEDTIANLVKEKGFDGIDIDFEGKKAETKAYFSTFLKGLYMRLGTKWLMCTIESRTPLDSRYYGAEIPKDAQIYANDFKEINKYCDRVRIMTYDQQGIDLRLTADAASSSRLYAPVADPHWVEKVVALVSKDISKDKLMIGVPTYGYEYEVTAYEGPEYLYDILWTFNPGYARPIAEQYGITPARNSAGELYFTYTEDSTAPASAGMRAADLAAQAAVLYANTNKSHLSFRLMDWPDYVSVEQKINLAKQLGVRGISIFKLDGGQDPKIWEVLGRSSVSSGVVSTPVSATFSRTLTLGSLGEDVRALQVFLNRDTRTYIAENGPGSPGRETTRFGSLTLRAVQKFQQLYGIASPGTPGFGVVGPATRAKLNQILQTL